MSIADGPDQPLAGLHVVDLGQLIPAPACTINLAWMGATVTKIEPPGGDPARSLYDGRFFELYNRGKRSVTLDLKDPDGQASALARCAEADVVVEGFRPGVADRLGVGPKQVRARQPRVVYCSITGFGSQAGDESPAHDLSFLARSGALGMPATYRAVGAPPHRPAIPVADLAGAAVATQAILAALFARERTGEGRHLEIAIHEIMLHWMAPRAGGIPGGDPQDDPERYLEPANDLYEAADGRWLAIAAIEPRLWGALCAALTGEADPRPGMASWTWRERREHAAELAAWLQGVFAGRPRDEWVELLAKAGVPADPVASPSEAFADPWVEARGLVQDGWVRPPLPFAGSLPPAPLLGADNDD